MNVLYNFWRRELAQNPVVVAPLLALVATLVMNARTGYALGNRSLLIALVFIALGLLTAYAGTVGLALKRWSPRKFGLVCWLVIGLALDQLCGWQTVGLLFADGQAARDSQATGLSSLSSSLKSKRAELEKLGVTRPAGAIEADMRLECAKTSRAYPDGVGPACTKLKAELAGAERARALEKEIAALLPQIESHAQVAEGAVQYDVPLAVARTLVASVDAKAAERITVSDIVFGFEMFLVAVLGIVANMGFWMVGVRHGPEDEPHDAGRGSGPGASGDDWGPRLLTSASGADLRRSADAAPATDWGPARASDAAASQAASPAQVAAMPAANAPINLTLHMPGAAPQAAPGAAAMPQQASPLVASQAVTPAAPVSAASPSPAASERPAQRSSINAAVDRILTFRAACLTEAGAEALLAIPAAYDRYVRWAQGRAVSAPAFQALMEASGATLTSIAGETHIIGAALRDERPVLKAV